jgi:hypothetical protein
MMKIKKTLENPKKLKKKQMKMINLRKVLQKRRS